MKWAAIFPGQGSQYVGMGREWYEKYKDYFIHAEEITGRNLTEIMFNGPEEVLNDTLNAQPAIYLLSSIIYMELSKKNNFIKPAYLAGHSLGEYTACFAAGVFRFEDGLKIVVRRAEITQEEGRKKPGAMAAVLGLKDEEVIEIINKIENETSCIIDAVNFNAPGQLVVAGQIEAIEKLLEYSKANGIKALRLKVSAAFHSRLMQDASERLKQFIENFEFNDAEIPVVTNIDAKPETLKEEFKKKLPLHVARPVLCQQSVNKMIELGVKTFVEIGPGNVMRGIMRRISRDINIFGVEKPDDIEKFLRGLYEIKR